ncbi:DMT family transporter [Robbsia sp. KACC 23696]|uniref:DMT family transporter n=1 Tax=Robbsia sp. KACC 23696 TaxID=3149231 RepID=UPI00325B3821
MNWILPLFAIVAGISNPLQSGANSAMAKGFQAPLVAGFVVYVVGALCLLICIPFAGLPLRSAFDKVGAVPWYGFLGGVFNAVFLLASLYVTKKIGSATFTTLVVISATVVSVALDNFGWLGFEVRAASPLRLVGAAFAIVGVILIAKF